MRNISSIFLLALMIILIISCEETPDPRPPAAAFRITPSAGSINTVFEFNGSYSSDDTDLAADLKVRWDFEGDGVWDTEFQKNKISTWQYETPDLYTVTMEVINSNGWTDLETEDLLVFADSVPPTASFIANPDTCAAGSIVHFSVKDSYDPYTPLNELTFRWDWQNDGTWDTPFTNDTSIFYHKYVDEGMYRILMEVKNNVQLTDTSSRQILVIEW